MTKPTAAKLIKSDKLGLSCSGELTRSPVYNKPSFKMTIPSFGEKLARSSFDRHEHLFTRALEGNKE